MCGIIGIISPRSKTLSRFDDLFKNMLVCDSLRGEDSTGIFAIQSEQSTIIKNKKKNRKKKIRYHKDVLPGYLYKDVEHIDAFMKDSWAIVGHNRAATKGEIIVQNSHPFVSGDLLGVHNGTISSFGTYAKEVNDKKFGTDSEGLYYLLNKYGPDAALKRLWGSWSLVYYNRADQTINFIRNNQRPMCIVQLKGGDIAFASEGAMLTWLVTRDRHAPSVEKVIKYDPNEWLKFKYDSNEPERSAVDADSYYDDWSKWSGKRSRHNYDFKNNTKRQTHNSTHNRTTWASPLNYSVNYKFNINHWEKIGPSVCWSGSGYTCDDRCTMTSVYVTNVSDKEKEEWSGHKLLGKLHSWDSHNRKGRINVDTVKIVPQYNGNTETKKVEDSTKIVDSRGLVCSEETTRDRPLLDLVRENSEKNQKDADYAECRMVLGPDNLYITEENFKKLVEGGCSSCGEEQHVVDSDNLIWTNDVRNPKPVCSQCSQSLGIRANEKLH